MGPPGPVKVEESRVTTWYVYISWEASIHPSPGGLFDIRVPRGRYVPNSIGGP